MSEVRVVTVLVTFNRLELLKEALSALFAQTIQPAKVLVVNNNSTDGTTPYLDGLSAEMEFVDHVLLPANIGGAGGFSAGLEAAAQYAPQYIWLMDDDTIPQSDALSELLRGVERTEQDLDRKVGFACSKALWTDGSPHRMNVPSVAAFVKGTPFYFSDDAFAVLSCTFVSVLIPAAVVRQVGLPYREYFIWVDDVEYTTRIINAGYVGICVTRSKVHHKTANNYTATIADGTPANAWKYFYEVRNKVHFWKVNYSVTKRIIFIPWYSMKFVLEALRRKDDRGKFVRVVLRGMIAGLFFRPCIRKVRDWPSFQTGDRD